MAPSLQPTAIPPPDSSMELTAVPIVYDEPIADLSACVCERLELKNDRHPGIRAPQSLELD